MKRTVKLSSLFVLLLVICLAFSVGCDKNNGGSDVTSAPTSTPTTECTHTFGEWETDKPASCTEEGTKRRTCANCSAFESEPLARLEHNYEPKVEVEPSCLGDGKKVFTCSLCSDSYDEAIVYEKYEADKIASTLKNSVGHIKLYDKNGKQFALGTGFVYSKDGKIVTNYHVIEKAHSGDITINGKLYQIKSVLAYDTDLDLAILKVDATDLVELKLCSNLHPTGKTVYAYGSSKGLENTFSRGIITNESREINGHKYIQHDAAVSGGNSGGPLVNEYCEVIAINTLASVVADVQNINLSVPVTELDKLSYDEELTLKEVTERERKPIDILKEFAIETGEYDEDDDTYTVMIDTQLNANTMRGYTSVLVYYEEEDILMISYVYINGNYMYSVFLGLEPIDGEYSWYYYDVASNALVGKYDPATFNQSTKLVCTEHHIVSNNTPEQVSEIATDLAHELCSIINDNYAFLDITAKDLGFSNY